MSKSIADFFERVTDVKEKEKRKLSSTSSSEGDSSPVVRQCKKKACVPELSGFPELREEGEEIMSELALQETLRAIERKLSEVATAEDVRNLGRQMEEKIGVLEGRLFDMAQKMDAMDLDMKNIKKENQFLKEKVRQLESDQNDSEQYDRRWNLRIFNIQEQRGEKSEDCAKRCCQIFTDQLGVVTQENDLEAAHRVGNAGNAGSTGSRPRPIIVRFHNRRLRDRVLADRKKLKGKGISIGEDLTAANYRLERAAYKHSASMATWSSNGKIFVKLKNGKALRIKFGDDVNAVLNKEMK